jgi:uncharacterized protein (DUF305 family)
MKPHMTPPSRSTVASLLLTFFAASCSRAGTVSRTSPQPAAAPANQPGSAKTRPGTYPFTQADVGFMSHMIDHHAQALVMAGWASTHGANPSVRTLAARIINGQRDEIATMQRWLQDRGQPVPEPDTSGMPMSMDHTAGQEHPSTGSGQAHMLMPGMLTEAQMKELDQARGADFDRLFLTDMIQHHRGAVTMVNELFGTRGAAREEPTFKLANDVSVDQTTEIARMQRMLDAMPAQHGAP